MPFIIERTLLGAIILLIVGLAIYAALNGSVNFIKWYSRLKYKPEEELLPKDNMAKKSDTVSDKVEGVAEPRGDGEV